MEPGMYPVNWSIRIRYSTGDPSPRELSACLTMEVNVARLLINIVILGLISIV